MANNTSHEDGEFKRIPESSLRIRAEEALREKISKSNGVDSAETTKELKSLVHELNVHQIELEIQNDELRSTQTALQISRARFVDLFDHSPVGYIQVSESGLIREANKTISSWLGKTIDSMRNQPISHILYKEDQNVFYELRRLLFDSGEPQSGELRVERRDGTTLWVQLSCLVALDSGDAKVIRIALIDISERKRFQAAHALIESQLRQSQKMEAIGTLAGGIAHDFNNILAVILANSELAIQVSRNHEEALKNVCEIQKAALRARELVKQILAFSRKQTTERNCGDLVPVIEDSIRLLRSTMPSRIQLTVECASDTPHVIADFTQLEQCLLNIATNAMQAMKGGRGKINLRLDTVSLDSLSVDRQLFQGPHWNKHKKAVRISIQDDGPGIAPEVLDHVFEPFFTSKPASEGTGLGLAVVHGIISSHEGEITVESDLGRGATFTIYLPPAEAPTLVVQVPMKATEEASATVEVSSNVARLGAILYLDDDVAVMESTCYLFQKYGLNMRGFSDQQEALNAIQANPMDFDVIVTDYNMRGLSGLDIASMVRAIRSDLPIVMTSGYIDEELIQLSAKVGVEKLIPKPFPSQLFCDLMRKLTSGVN